MSLSLKSELLRLLREDEEFRLAVAGLLGLDAILGELKKLREDFLAFVREQEKRWEENNRRWEEAYKRFEAIELELKALREDQRKLWEEIRRIWEEVNKIWMEIKALRENQEKTWRELRAVRRDLDSVKRAVETMSLSIEDEANDFVKYYLKQRGIFLETAPAVINGYEFDIYGTNGSVTVVGEVKVRAGTRVVKKVSERIDEALKKRPEKFPGRVVKVLYCLKISTEALEEASKLGIWVIESGKERNKPSL